MHVISSPAVHSFIQYQSILNNQQTSHNEDSRYIPFHDQHSVINGMAPPPVVGWSWMGLPRDSEAA